MNEEAMSTEYEKRLLEVLARHAWFMQALDAVCATGMRQWCVGGGVIRNIDVDDLNGNSETVPRDVDVAYFDPSDLSIEADLEYQMLLQQNMPGIPWEVTNQAGVHLWFHKRYGYKVAAIESIADAVATWSETCTAVAVTKRREDDYKIYAPYGFDDLFKLIVRRNPLRCDVKTYQSRIAEKKYEQHWKSVKVINEKRLAFNVAFANRGWALGIFGSTEEGGGSDERPLSDSTEVNRPP